ncbi:type VI secretion system Vgr family protein [Sorangium sp. So ce406]|uniref:type VI secretion system Vgr family protein n=1 Tax=Sorangium sp. So ce406 TaxID=3133311 RepID=UPI003F5C8BFB
MSLCELEIDGVPLDVAAARGRLALSELFRFEVEAFAREDPPAPADLVGRPFTLTLRDRFGSALAVRGLVMAVERTLSALGAGSFVLTLGPAVEALTVGADCRVYQEQTPVSAVKDALARGGLDGATRWVLRGSCAERPCIAQYRESDWSFVERLLAEEGIAYWFECGEDATTLVLGDDTTAAADLPGGAAMPFQDDSQLAATRDAVQRLRRTHRARTEAVRLRDYDPQKPRFVLEGRATRGKGALEVYDYPGRFSRPDAAQTRAARALEALSADRDIVSGEASGVRLLPGYVIAIEDHPVDSLNGRYLLRAVTCDLRQPRHGQGLDEEWSVRWEAQPASIPFRPPRRAVTRTPGGPQTGTVVGPAGQEIHPDDAGRVRVQFHWDRLGGRDENASTWQRVGQLPLPGSMILPRVGWDVLAYHHDEDIDAPAVVAHLYDGEHPTPYALPANKTRTSWQTATTPGGGSTNEIRFEDKVGSEEMFIQASKDQKIVVGNNLEAKIGTDHTVAVGANQRVTIGSNAKATIGGDQSVQVGASESLTVSGSRSVAITGAESATIGASRTQIATAGTTLDAQSGRTLTVGGSMIGASALEASRSTLGSASVSVAGAHIAAAGSGVSHVTLGACAETVGGAKIEAAGSSYDLSGKGAVALTVGGANVIAAGSNIGESSTSKMKVIVGGAFVGNAPTISIEAENEILIVAGAASLKIKPGSVEVKAPAIGLPAGTIDTGGSVIEHN